MGALEEYKNYLNDETLTEEQVKEKFAQDKQKFDNDVNKIVDGYQKLDMNRFIERIGGQEKIDEMSKINEKLDRSKLINGNLVEKNNHINEDLEQWKKGFMDGFEEAYKRLHGCN